MKTKALFAGSFDPFHLGHLSIALRAGRLFDDVVIGIAADTGKHTLDIDKRFELVDLCIKNHKNISVISYQGLTVDLYKDINASVLIRGVRNIFDFEYEKNLAAINNVLYSNMQTCLLLCDIGYEISSSLVRQFIKNNVDLTKFVPNEIIDLVKELYA
ncbi:MAG: pantetheine-phosphate adenylyltransferase [Firmicutes bacterium]|nr:pantetheine-phosphate adenylyltransferase [Bacillota bacterium]